MVKNISLILLFLVLLNGFMYWHQPAMIFFPFKGLVQTPADWGMDYEDVYMETSDQLLLHGWFIPHPESKGTVLICHGNAGNISHRGDTLAIFHRMGLNVLIFDYRGYGRSEGTPSEEGIYNDARAAWKYLTGVKGIKSSNITLFGRSLGGVVAARLAREVQPNALIMESAFSSARDVAKEVFPLISRLVYLRYKFDAAEYLKEVDAPLLVLHSEEDEIIPYHLGQRLFAAGKKPKYFKKLTGDHNNGFLMSQPDYENALNEFLFKSY